MPKKPTHTSTTKARVRLEGFSLLFQNRKRLCIESGFVRSYAYICVYNVHTYTCFKPLEQRSNLGATDISQQEKKR